MQVVPRSTLTTSTFHSFLGTWSVNISKASLPLPLLEVRIEKASSAGLQHTSLANDQTVWLDNLPARHGPYCLLSLKDPTNEKYNLLSIMSLTTGFQI